MEIIDITKKYGKKVVLNHVSLQGPAGKCVGILGGNGCGKSTLLSILGGTQKKEEGSFMWQGQDLLADRKLHRQVVGYMPQEPPLLEELTAADNLSLWYERPERERALYDGVLAMLGINDFLKVPVAKMSGGMKKRLAIGCAVANNPRILLLDEPSAALDLPCKERILNYLLEFKKNGGAVILATHDVQEISMCDMCYILKEGQLVPYTYDGNVHRLVGQL